MSRATSQLTASPPQKSRKSLKSSSYVTQRVTPSYKKHVALADVAFSRLPRSITELAEDPEAWVTR